MLAQFGGLKLGECPKHNGRCLPRYRSKFLQNERVTHAIRKHKYLNAHNNTEHLFVRANPILKGTFTARARLKVQVHIQNPFIEIKTRVICFRGEPRNRGTTANRLVLLVCSQLSQNLLLAAAPVVCSFWRRRRQSFSTVFPIFIWAVKSKVFLDSSCLVLQKLQFFELVTNEGVVFNFR